MRNWLLPEHIADILPTAARQVESAKAAILENFRTCGYELVLPPMLEYVGSLVDDDDTGLLLKTFRVVDQLSGRLLGVRADITPQVARIDAHLLAGCNGITRLCYAGSVLHTRPDGLMSSREPLQIGAELYGYAGGEADQEIIELMLSTLRLLNVDGLQLNLGHIGIFRALIAEAGIDAALGSEILALLQTKDSSSLQLLLDDVAAPWRDALLALAGLYGGIEVLDEARHVLPALPAISQALQQLAELGTRLSQQVNVSFDLAELRGDTYHTGLLFAVYAPGWPDALARGGRYDNVGRRFGRARPATGFSLDLRDLIRILPQRDAAKGIRVAAADRDAAREEIARLRESGEVVVIDYLGETAGVLHCNRQLVAQDGGWQLKAFG